MAELRQYGVSDTIQFPLIDAGAADFESTPVAFAAGDTKISIDGAGFVNTINVPTHLGQGIYTLTLTIAELTGAKMIVTIKDQTVPKAWEDQAVNIETYGNAAAQHAFNLNSASVVASTVTDKTGFSLTSAEEDAIVDKVWDELRAAHAAAGSFGQGAASVQGNVTGSVASVTGNVAGSVVGNVDGTVGGFTAGAKAEIQTEVDNALVARNLDHLISAVSTVNDVTPAANNFDIALAATNPDEFKGYLVKFVSGALANLAPRRVSASTAGATPNLTFTEAFTAAPANGDTFVFINDAPVDISAGAFWDELEGVEPAAPIGNNATFRTIFQHLKRRFFNKVTQTASQQTIYRDDSTTVLEVMVVNSDTATQTQTKGKAA